MGRTGLTVFVVVLGLGACTAQIGVPEGRHGDGESEVTVSLVGVAEGFTREGDWLVSPVLAAPDGASRVGAMLVLHEEGGMPLLRARATEGGLPAGDWAPLGETFAEVDHHVGVADLASIGDGAQLAVAAADVDRIRSLTWSAVVPVETDGDETASEVEGAPAPLRADLGGLGIVTREAWGARATRCTSRDATPTRMAIHYTVTPSENPARQVRAVQAYHMDTRRWCDVGYHFLVGADGTIYEGRRLDLLGAHVANHNSGNIGIAFVGCFHPTGCASFGPTRPPDAMIEQGGRLLGTLSRLYGITLSTTYVKGHRDHRGADTSCPGDHLAARMGDLLAIGRARGLGGGTAPPPGEPPPAPPPSDPCAVASCWNPAATVRACGSWSMDENFATGRYAVHRYAARLLTGGETTLRVLRTAGTFAPALLVTDRTGRAITTGTDGAGHPDVEVRSVAAGRTGDRAEVTLVAAREIDVYLHVTAWSVVEAGFRGSVSTTARYRLSTEQRCVSTGGDVHAGLTQAGNEIPRAGLSNATLRATLGISVEPYGSVVTHDGGSWVRGKVSWFGGPRDTGIGTTETGAITGERMRSLNDPVDADAATLMSRPEDYYYVAMRWNYSPGGRTFWAGARLVITNPTTGAQVVVRPVDWGPHTSTRRIVDLSPQALEDLGLSTDQDALVSFAAPGTPLGPVR